MIENKEVWQQIKHHKKYLISNFGRIKSLCRNRELILKNCIITGGYCGLKINENGINYFYKVHRLVGEYFIPNPNNYPQINHKDGNKINNNNWNLEWCTAQENIQHAIKIGLCYRKGEFSQRHILTEKQVLEIRKKYIPKIYTIKILANEYNISISCIKLIIQRRNWIHI